MQLQESRLPDQLRVAEALELYSSFYRDPADWRELMEVLGISAKARTPFRKRATPVPGAPWGEAT